MSGPLQKKTNDEILAAEEEKVAKQLLGETDTEMKDTQPAEGEQEEAGESQETETQEPESTPEQKQTAEQAPEDQKPETEKKELSQDTKVPAREESRAKRSQTEIEKLKEEVSRMRELLTKTREVKIDMGSLQPRKPSSQAPQSNLPWMQPGQNGQEHSEEQALTPEELDQRVQQNIIKGKVWDRLQNDREIIEESYPQFVPGDEKNPNPEFDQNLVDFVSQTYEALFRKDPTIRLLDHVKQIMQLRQAGIDEGQRQQKSVIEKQAAEQAVDPSSSPTVVKNDNVEGKIKNAKNSKELAELEKLLPHAE